MFIGDALNPVGTTRNATSDAQIETSIEHEIPRSLNLLRNLSALTLGH